MFQFVQKLNKKFIRRSQRICFYDYSLSTFATVIKQLRNLLLKCQEAFINYVNNIISKKKNHVF